MELEDTDTNDWLDLFDESDTSWELLQNEIGLGGLLEPSQDFDVDQIEDDNPILESSIFNSSLFPETTATLSSQPTGVKASSGGALRPPTPKAFTFFRIPDHHSMPRSIHLQKSHLSTTR
jgi:hypothetical protein